MNESAAIVPAPWQLKGEGIILMYTSLRKQFEKTDFFLPYSLKSNFSGGLGYVMLVNYTESPVGPYKELLVIPGKCKTPHGPKQTISKIYVDSAASLKSGRANWGIPKELAQFDWSKDHKGTSVQVKKEDEVFFDITVKNKPIKFPLTTAILPIRLYQELNDTTYQVNPSGRGIGQLAKASINLINPDFFPDVRGAKCLAVSVNPFWMKFP
ncbi:MAG: acetoacetate decarboxylase family protein [Cytophagales bacterium]|nr:acetoacetate decarboxylase family protein [Cytophagales bacterium]